MDFRTPAGTTSKSYMRTGSSNDHTSREWASMSSSSKSVYGRTRKARVGTANRARHAKYGRILFAILLVVVATLVFTRRTLEDQGNPIVVVMGASGASKESLIKGLGGQRDSLYELEGVAFDHENLTTYHVHELANEQPAWILNTPDIPEVNNDANDADNALAAARAWESTAITLASIGKPLTGIVYVYDVSRDGSSFKDIELFAQFVGAASFKNAEIAFTNWTVKDSLQIQRIKNQWLTLTDYDGRILKYNGEKDSVPNYRHYLGGRKPAVPQIVDEIVVQKKKWADTAVGKALIVGAKGCARHGGRA
ncbi:hypothetical protein CC86DRAFT_376933 [Ophiobolus disseminans]|uniref:G domain-containing protein n=1 Tax=Ophiobolus disseminans TaxID=1469910 RepID=A0A6A7AMY1_9PLEO|nr:hypothetical protein CC86DRAFT_376933 [Ophiobolus disseminans]